MYAFMIKPYMNFSPATNIAALMYRALLKIAPPLGGMPSTAGPNMVFHPLSQAGNPQISGGYTMIGICHLELK